MADPQNLPFLQVEALSRDFGGIRAVDDLSFTLQEGRILSLVGANGAGKTTLFNMLTGQQRPSGGHAIFCGTPLTGLSPDRIVRLGIARTFQNIRLFGRRTCEENVLVPLQQHAPYSLCSALLRTPKMRRQEKTLREKAGELLSILGLEAEAKTAAANLPYGLQRKLEIARALATEPRLLLLDEPAAGMNPEEIRSLAETIGEVRRRFRVSLLIIEHHMDLVMRLCQDILVLQFGQLLARGTPEAIRQDPRVVAAYLGKGGTPCPVSK